MSAASRPRRRIRLTVPASLIASGTPPPESASAEIPPAPDGPPLAPLAAPRRPRGHLQLTRPTVDPPDSPPSGDGAASATAAREQPPVPEPTAPPPSAHGSVPAPRPHRRLRLTVPSGLGVDACPPDGVPLPHRVQASYYLPEETVARLEEEWWRRQAAGETWSRADIVQAALDEALSDPDRLTEALSRTVRKRASR